MEPLKIKVNGESSISRLAEQGVLRLTVTSEGQVLATVSKEVVSRSNELSELFKTLSPKADDGTATDDAAVTQFASTFLRTRSYTPRDKDNMPLARVYQASMTLRIVFRDINKLSQVVGQLVTYSNVEINSIDWSLSDPTQNALCSQMRREAVRDAVDKANDYAGEVGREVYPVKIMDNGTTAVTKNSQGALFSGTPLFGAATRGGGGLFGYGSSAPNNTPELSETLDLSPPDVQVTVSVSVDFQSVPVI